VKNVGGCIRTDVTREELPGSDEAWRLWEEARRWLYDPTLYAAAAAQICAADIPTAALSDAHIDAMIAAGTVRQVTTEEFDGWLADGKGVATAFCFGRAEHVGTEKARLRPIRWPRAVNDAVGREELFAPAPPLRDDVRAAGLQASWGAALDGQAYFDQFGLDPAIHRFFLFRAPSGRLCAATALAMGFRLASDVGTAFMRLLSDPGILFGASDESHPDLPDAVDNGGHRDANADNVRILHANKDKAIRAVTRFVERCAAVGCRLNEVDTTAPLETRRAASAAVVTQQIDFFGEVTDLAKKTVCARAKHATKARDLLARFNEVEMPPWRTVMGAVALGLWAAPIFRVELAPLAPLFMRLQAFGRRAAADPLLWDAVAERDEALLSPTRALLQLLATNAPTAIDSRLTRRAPFQCLIVDACAQGWGAISVRPQSGSLRWFCGRWPSGIPHSAVSEPAGVLAAAEAAVPAAAEGVVRILTDHRAFPSAMRRQRSFAEHLNTVLAALRTRFPAIRWEVQYIRGSTNPADGLSRGRGLTARDIESAYRLALEAP
jgi:hypothetical protein